MIAAILASAWGDSDSLLLYFRGNGEAGAYAATGAGGAFDQTLGTRALIAPKIGRDRLMRDPSVAPGADGTWHMVWTSGWWDRHIGYASTRDFITWSDQTAIPVMEHEAEALNAWAPEVVYDAAGKRFVIYWSSTIRGKFGETSFAGGDKTPDGTPLNHRFYYMTTVDFKEFSPTALLWDPGFNCIDATMISRGGEWLMVGKDETKVPPAKFLFTATAKSPTGPWMMKERRITGDYWAEGPIIVPSETGLAVLFDRYMDNRWGAVAWDGGSWAEAGDAKVPPGARHGCVVKVGADVVAGLRKHLASSE